MKPVTDPALLAQLEDGEGAPAPAASNLKPVTDPQLIEQLEAPNPTTDMSTGQKVAAGAGKAVMDLGRGAKQGLDIPAVWLERKFEGPPTLAELITGERKQSLLGRLGKALGMPTAADSARETKAEIEEARKLEAPLMATTSGKVGNVLGAVALAVLTAPVAALNTVRGAAAVGATQGFLQPTVEGESRTLNTAAGGAGGAIGQKVGNKIAEFISRKLSSTAASEAARKSADASKNAALAAGRDAGYVVPPSQANPTAVNRVLESVAGKLSTAQSASAKNQEVTNRLAALGLRLPHNRPITPEALAAIRKEAGQAYEALGQGQFVADATYKARLEGLAAAQKKLAEEFPELASKDVLKIAEGMKKEAFDGRTLVELTKALREKATAAYRAGEAGAAKFYKGAAREVEDLMERNLAYTGNGGPNALREFKEARKLIAKSYAAEAALNPATGNIDAAVFAQAVKKGKPISDEFKTIGEFASAFPKATRQVDKVGSVLPGSPLDWATAGGVSAISGNPALMLGVLARPAARSALLSKFFQSIGTTPSYGPSVVLRDADAAGRTELAKRIAAGLGTATALEGVR